MPVSGPGTAEPQASRSAFPAGLDRRLPAALRDPLTYLAAGNLELG